ncbi:MAG: site-specific integrase [Cognaticolwellia sp.]
MAKLTHTLGLPATGKVSKSISFNGSEFDTEEDKWILSKSDSINTGFISSLSPSIQEDIRCTLCYFAEHKSASHTCGVHSLIKLYFKSTNETTITEHGLLTFKSGFTKKDEHRVGVLRIFLKMLHVLGFDAVNEECLELLNSWKISGNQMGVAVLSLDPEDGPFSDIEFEAILGGLDNRYAENKLNDEDYSIAQLFAATGRRPIQISSLKIGDIRIDTKLLGIPTYILNIPRAKVQGRGFRTEFSDFAIAEYIGQVLNKHIKQVVKKTNEIFGRLLNEDEIALIPLFPDYMDLQLLKDLPQDDLLSWLNTDATHLKNGEMTKKLKIIIGSLEINSERTTELLKITAYRFRYTIGTRAARENAGVLTIATLLDHATTQCAGIYVKNHPDHASTISRIMNGPLLMYANAFQGRIVKDEADACDNLPSASRIRTEDSQHNVGSCGTNAFCRDYAPVACYLCKKFMPWQDAPHHLILKYLVDERDRINNDTGDLAIAAINDRAIIAVSQVILQCDELNRGKE